MIAGEAVSQLNEVSSQIQDLDINQDPLGNYAVWTPEVQALGDQVSRWIKMDMPGATVVGLQRCGKTWACNYLANTLSDLVGYPLAIFIWMIPTVDIHRDRYFFQDRLVDSGCPATSHRDLAVLKERLFDHIAKRADRTGARRVIIIVDDSQNLELCQFESLMHCSNRLEAKNLRPFFLLVGQPELAETANDWRQKLGLQILGRFFTHIYQFRGVKLEDIGEILDSFELTNNLEKVKSSALNVVDEALLSGWKLSNIETPFKEAVNILLAKHNIQDTVRLPMQYLRGTIICLLNDMIENKINPNGINTAHVLDALNASGFPAVMVFYLEQTGT